MYWKLNYWNNLFVNISFQLHLVLQKPFVCNFLVKLNLHNTCINHMDVLLICENKAYTNENRELQSTSWRQLHLVFILTERSIYISRWGSCEIKMPFRYASQRHHRSQQIPTAAKKLKRKTKETNTAVPKHYFQVQLFWFCLLLALSAHVVFKHCCKNG